MATFEDTVIATGRDTFHRLDELEDQHPFLADKSGNNRHAECFDVVDHVHGIASPVESDPSPHAMRLRVGKWTDTVNRFNTFTWFMFGFTSNHDGNARTLLCRSGEVSLGASNIVWTAANGLSINARLRIGGVSHLLSAASVPNQWYFVALRYNAGVIDLLLNAVVSDTDNATGDMEVGGEDRFFIGAQHSAVVNSFTSAGVDEVATGPALNNAQLLEILESSQNSLSLRGHSNVLPSAVWISQPDPTPIQFPFRHNFEEPLLERISFLTNNSKTLGGSVESGEMRPSPRREIEISQLVRSDDERRALRAKLWAHQHKLWFVPIRQDFGQLDSTLSSGLQTLPTVTQYKDFEVDSWVGIRELDDQGSIVKSEVLQIDAVNPNNIHATTPTINSYSAFSSYIYPVRRGIVSRSFSVQGHTDAVEEIVLVFELLAQDEAVIPNRITSWTPTIVYKGYEAYDPAIWQSHNWADGRQYDVDRSLSRVDFETGIFEVDSDTPGAEEAFEYRMLLKGRDKIALFLGWLYSRGGSLNYLWIPSMQQDFAVTGSASPTITVEKKNYSENFALAEARRDLAFVYHDNTMSLRRVTGFSGSPDETLTLSPNVPTLTNLRSLSILKFCQMESDSVELAWVTDDLIQVAWRFKELLSTPA